MSEADVPNTLTGIAIIGMSGRFPGASTLEAFWQNLCDGVESVTFFSDEEALAAGVDSALLGDPRYVKARAIIDGIEQFDAGFFGYTPREAEVMDPQQRLFLECAWTALEHAGYDSETYSGAISVYAGAAMNYYMIANLYPNRRMLAVWGELQSLIGSDKDHLTTRVSYKLNLKGPSVTVQTACSTGLVAVSMACQSLLDYQCDMALAGGVSLGVPQKAGYFYSEGGIGSPDGHCRAFDAQGRGTVGGDGVGVVVLKRLDDALADGDTIHAVILGFATNNDGAAKVGYTAPSIEGQAQAIAAAQAIAGIDPATISYIEAHGTATTLGDPIEIAALTQAFRTGTDRSGFCAIGSVKTNIGHLNTAAGVAGLIKTVLALKHRRIPPSLHFQSPNPQIDFASSPFYINTQLSAWPAGPTPRRAGVSSFGMGGTNAHVVLEEAPPPQLVTPSRPWQLLLLSARTLSALDAATTNLAAYFEQQRGASLPDVAYTLQVGRRAFAHRCALLCRDAEDARQALMTRDPKRMLMRYQEPQERPIVFLFPGQGAQYVGMGADLYRSEPLFREQIDRCAELLRPHLGFDLRAVMFDEGRRTNDQDKETRRQGDKEAPGLLVSLSPGLEPADQSLALHPESVSGNLLEQTWLAQPALFAVEYALARLWMSWGVQPQAMIGHSVGEYVAATLAGVLTLEDGLALMAARGRLMQQLPAGAMLSVRLSADELQPLLGPGLALAAINGPALCVASGPSAAIAALRERLAAQGVESQPLHTSHAFHSVLMEPILESFAEQLRRVTLRPPAIPYISNMTGSWITQAEATDPEYWAAHLRRTVRFADGIRTLLEDPNRILLEVGPGQTLATLARVQAAPDRVVLSSLRHPYEQQPDDAFLLGALAQLWLAGARVDWPGFYVHERRRRIPLPTYPFERQRYWVETGQAEAPALAGTSVPRAPLSDWFSIPSWKRSAPPDSDDQGAPADAAGGWLILLDAAGLGAALLAELEQRGQPVVGVVAGDSFARLDERSYRLRPLQRDDYTSLLDALRADGPLPRVIVHLWALDTPAADDLAAAEQEFYSLLYLAQAFGEVGDDAPRQIAVISNRLHAVTGDEDLVPAHATLLGPCLVLPQEYPQLTCRNIDFALPQGRPAPLPHLCDQLIAEVSANLPDRVVAYRGAHRWVQTVESLRLAPTPQPHPRLRQGGVYLITGGLGGMGLTFAEYLARSVRARLVLTTRAELPPRDRWDERLAQADVSDRLAQAVRVVSELEAQGAEVEVLRADVTDAAQMQAALAQAEARFGALHGVIHAAGLPGGGLAQLKTPEAAMAVLAPKLQGTLALEAALQGRPLDFLVLCSSLTALLGGIGQIDYCAANAFLDAFAQRRTLCDGALTIAINWDGWQTVGMAVDSRLRQPWTMLHSDEAAALEPLHPQPATMEAGLAGELQSAPQMGMLPGEGVEVFARILGRRHALPQVIVSTTPLVPRIAEVRALTQALVLETLERLNTQPSHARPDLATAYAVPETELEETIAQMWCQVLGIERVGIHDNFFELGGHSLLAVQLLSRVRAAFQVELSLPMLFETPTVAELAETIETLRWASADLHAPPEVMAGYTQGEV